MPDRDELLARIPPDRIAILMRMADNYVQGRRMLCMLAHFVMWCGGAAFVVTQIVYWAIGIRNGLHNP